MKRSILAVIILGWLSLAGNAVALERWDFGRLAYGSQVKTAPSWAIGYACDEDGGCSFKDDQGGEYRTWEDDVIVIKTFDITPENRHSIPFGIDYAQDMPSIVMVVERKTGKTFRCADLEREPGTVLCRASVLDLGAGVALHMRFGQDGKLRQIEIWTHYI